MSIYTLSSENSKNKKRASWSSFSKYHKGLRLMIIAALVFVGINSAVNVATPFLLGDITDKYIVFKKKDELGDAAILLIVLYLIGALSSYFQIRVMGKVGQIILYRLRNQIFIKLQSLPLEFFNANKSGDLISRINSDTEKLNQALSETLLRFIGNIFIILGIGGMMLYLNFKLGLIALGSTVGIFIVTQVLGPWIRDRNKDSLKKLGALTGEIQESLSNFKVVIAFNRRDYFRKNFESANEANRKSATLAGIANNILTPIYDFGGNLSTLLVLVVGINMIMNGDLTIGLLISYITYTDRFYQPLRIMAQLFSSIQTSIAAWARVGEVLNLESNLEIVPHPAPSPGGGNKGEGQGELLSFENVSFGYDPETMILKNLNFHIDTGKTYALVGPTGGGKSTTASLMARLYDASEGVIKLHGNDIRTYRPDELSAEVGFILQEPFLFTGNVGDNIKYGNEELGHLSNEQLKENIIDLGLEKLLERFKDGLDTEVKNSADSISLGQKQLVAFLRVILRKPKMLILDEATANIDTVTESLLQDIIEKLPEDTTKIIIAHRLNTIEKADEIFFIANGEMQRTMSFKNAMELIENKSSKS